MGLYFSSKCSATSTLFGKAIFTPNGGKCEGNSFDQKAFNFPYCRLNNGATLE